MKNNKITISSLINLSIPCILTLVILSIYEIISGMIVSKHLGELALSAITIVMPITMFTRAFAMMICTGASAIIAGLLGEKKVNKANEVFSFIFILIIASSILLSFLGIVYIEPLLAILGVKEQLYSLCYEYTYIRILFFSTTMLVSFFQIFLILVNKSKSCMIIIGISGIFNILLTYLFVVFLNLGLKGSALAVVLSNVIPVLYGIYIFKSKNNTALTYTKPKISLKLLIKCFTNGSSEMVTSLSQAVTILLYNIVINKTIGVDGIITSTIAIYAYTFFSTVFIGYSMSIAPKISYSYALKDYDSIKLIHKKSKIIITIAGFSIALISFIFAHMFVGLFINPCSELYNLSIHGFKLFSICFIFMGFGIYGSAMFTAYPNGKISALISVLRTFVFISGSIILLPYILKENGIWLAMPFAEFLALLVVLYYFNNIHLK